MKARSVSNLTERSSGSLYFIPTFLNGRSAMTNRTETDRILSDDELLSVSGGRCPITNGDDPRFQQTMQAMQVAYRQAKYFGGSTCP